MTPEVTNVFEHQLNSGFAYRMDVAAGKSDGEGWVWIRRYILKQDGNTEVWTRENLCTTTPFSVDSLREFVTRDLRIAERNAPNIAKEGVAKYLVRRGGSQMEIDRGNLTETVRSTTQFAVSELLETTAE